MIMMIGGNFMQGGEIFTALPCVLHGDQAL